MKTKYYYSAAIVAILVIFTILINATFRGKADNQANAEINNHFNYDGSHKQLTRYILNEMNVLGHSYEHQETKHYKVTDDMYVVTTTFIETDENGVEKLTSVQAEIDKQGNIQKVFYDKSI